MHSKMLSVLFIIISIVIICEATSQEMEARGKKKKIALFVYFADLVVKKIFVLKLIYAFVFWVVLHKAGYFLAWFASYLKEQKHHHHEHYDYHGPHHEYASNYGPYRRQTGLF